jgi:hypothetical protein
LGLNATGCRDGIEQKAPVLGFHDGRDAYHAAEFGPLDEEGWVIENNLLDHKPVKEAAKHREMLLDGRRSQRLWIRFRQTLQRTNRGELKAVLLGPAAELRGGLDISRTGIFIADGSGEEFEEIFAGFVTMGLGTALRMPEAEIRHTTGAQPTRMIRFDVRTRERAPDGPSVG